MGPQRTLTCYHCAHVFGVSAKAVSCNCPKCSKLLQIQDVVIKGTHSVRKLQTCGKILVEVKGKLIAPLIQSSLGVEVLGSLEGNVVTPGPVRLGKKASWKGDCTAPTLSVELGAVVTRGYFHIGPDALAESSRARSLIGVVGGDDGSDGDDLGQGASVESPDWPEGPKPAGPLIPDKPAPKAPIQQGRTRDRAPIIPDQPAPKAPIQQKRKTESKPIIPDTPAPKAPIQTRRKKDGPGSPPA